MVLFCLKVSLFFFSKNPDTHSFLIHIRLNRYVQLDVTEKNRTKTKQINKNEGKANTFFFFALNEITQNQFN